MRELNTKELQSLDANELQSKGGCGCCSSRSSYYATSYYGYGGYGYGYGYGGYGGYGGYYYW